MWQEVGGWSYKLVGGGRLALIIGGRLALIIGGTLKIGGRLAPNTGGAKVETPATHAF